MQSTGEQKQAATNTTGTVLRNSSDSDTLRSSAHNGKEPWTEQSN